VGVTPELIEALSWSFSLTNPKSSLHDYQAYITQKALEFREVQRSIGALAQDPRISNLMAAASAEIEQGRFNEADEILAAAEEVQHVEHTLREIKKQSEIRRARGDAALLNGDSVAALEHYLNESKLLAVFDPAAAARERLECAEKMFLHGRRFNDIAVYCGIDLVSQNLSIDSRESVILERAKSYCLRSMLYRVLGYTKSGSQGKNLLDQAIDDAEKGLAILPSERDFTIWGELRNSLAISMNEQGRRLENSTGRMQQLEAIKIYKDTLAIVTPEKNDYLWGRLQNNLSLALNELGKRTTDSDSVKTFCQSIDACRAALRVRKQDANPNEWAMTQNNLAIAQRALGDRTAGIEGVRLIKKSIEGYKNAMQVNSFEKNPIEWSKLQNNMGNALKALATRTNGKASASALNESMDALNASLLVRTKEAHPLHWAETMRSIGDILVLLSQKPRAKSVQFLNMALSSFDLALTVFDPDNTSLDFGECSRAKSAAENLLKRFDPK
jgi:tetratricopeptide (TPR) repeat protein